MSGLQWSQSDGVGQIINAHSTGPGGINIYDNDASPIVSINSVGDISSNNLFFDSKLFFTNSIQSSCIIPRYTNTFSVSANKEYTVNLPFSINATSIPAVRIFYCTTNSPTFALSQGLSEITQNTWVWRDYGGVNPEVIWTSNNTLRITTSRAVAYTRTIPQTSGYYTIYVY
jgi:hypothetical protein